MQDQSTDQKFELEDFQEVPSVVRTKGFHPVLIAVGGSFLGLILALVLIHGSMPEMTPEQIVAMDGYEGEQAPRYIFNLGSLEARGKPESADKSSDTDDAHTTALYETNAQAQANHTAGITAPTNSASPSGAMSAMLAIEMEEPKDTWSLEIVEVPASPVIVGKDAQEVAAPVVDEFDYRKLNRRVESPAHHSETKDRMAVPQDKSETRTTIRVLPVFTVNTDSAYIRAEPKQSSDIKLVLAKGTSVTAFEKSGAWVHVGANDGSSITGYVHQSTIAVTEIN